MQTKQKNGQYLNDTSVAGSIPRSIGKEMVISDIIFSVKNKLYIHTKHKMSMNTTKLR